MGNIISYVEGCLDAFKSRSITSVDSLVLSQLSYIHFDRALPHFSLPVRVGDLFKAEYFEGLFGGIRVPELNRALFTAAAASPRFRDIQIFSHVSHLDCELEKQFSATCFLLPDLGVYVAFRGTDGTLVGWKEDFNMAYRFPVPAQQEGAEWLRKCAEDAVGDIRVGGHSKGGNIAVYAAMKCLPELSHRIKAVYSHDGPGFKSEVIGSAEFKAVAPIIDKTLPQSSLIGMLLQNQERYTVVKSDRFWIYQHDPFSWQTEGCDFVYEDNVTGGAEYLNSTLRDWLEQLPDDRRKMFVDTVFDVIQSTGAETFSQIAKNPRKYLPMLYEAEKRLDPECRHAAVETARGLASLAVKNLGSAVEPDWADIDFLRRDVRRTVDGGT